MTTWTKERRPGGYPRRKPQREHDYSNDTRKAEGAFAFLILFIPTAVTLLMGVGM